MKKILFALLVVVLASCASSRKAAKDKSEHVIDSTATTETKTESSAKVIDTTRIETGEIIITEIEFYPPDADAATDTSGTKGTTDVTLQGFGNLKNTGGVKKVTQTQIRKTDEHKGTSEERTTAEESKSNANVTRRDKEEHKESTPVPDPYRWRYIAFIVAVLLAAIVLLYLKRQPILNVIRNFIASIRRFLK